jgi:thiosulfate/3-mercaptopyruvate sulfurtransferase
MANNNVMRRLWMAALLSLWAFAASAGDKPEFMVDADWLAKNLKDPKLVVLEIRYHYFTVGGNHAIPTSSQPFRLFEDVQS